MVVKFPQDVFFVSLRSELYFRVVFRGWSAPIRSAMTFYFDLDVRIFFSTSSKNIFSIDQKKSHRKKKRKFQNFKKSKMFKEKTQNFEIFEFSIFEILKMFDFFLQIFANIFSLYIRETPFSSEKHLFLGWKHLIHSRNTFFWTGNTLYIRETPFSGLDEKFQNFKKSKIFKEKA